MKINEKVLIWVAISFFIAAIAIFIPTHRDSLFYDSEGNEIPHSVVNKLVRSQFTKIDKEDSSAIKRYFDFPDSNRVGKYYIDFPEEWPLVDSSDNMKMFIKGDTIHIEFNNPRNK